MKNIFLIYDDCCFYEIVILSYFMKFTGQEAALCSMDGKKIKCIEGYSVDVDLSIEDININDVNSLIITGGDISSVNNEKVHNLIISLANRDVTISAICAGVDVLDGAGVLRGVKSTHSVDADIVIDKNYIKSKRAIPS